jgi:hypothetical protein
MWDLADQIRGISNAATQMDVLSCPIWAVWVAARTRGQCHTCSFGSHAAPNAAIQNRAHVAHLSWTVLRYGRPQRNNNGGWENTQESFRAHQGSHAREKAKFPAIVQEFGQITD